MVFLKDKILAVQESLEKVLKGGVVVLLSLFGHVIHAQSFDYDSCSNILRDGVRDDIDSRNSQKYALIKHNQFCVLAKKHQLNGDNFENFARVYSEHTRASTSGGGGGASIGFGPFSFGGDYGQSSDSSSLSRDEKEDLLNRHSEEVLDYYYDHCGNESYQEFLENEAHSLSKVANQNIVEAWKQCMLKKHGIFAYLESGSHGLEVSIRVDWYSVGNNYIKNLSLMWYGDNIKTPYPLIENHNSNEFKQTENICEFHPIYSGGNLVIPVHRNSDKKNERIFLKVTTDNHHSQGFSIQIPKNNAIESSEQGVLINKACVSKYEGECERLRIIALKANLISKRELKELRESDEAPIIVGEGSDREIFGWVKCIVFLNKIKGGICDKKLKEMELK